MAQSVRTAGAALARGGRPRDVGSAPRPVRARDGRPLRPAHTGAGLTAVESPLPGAGRARPADRHRHPRDHPAARDHGRGRGTDARRPRPCRGLGRSARRQSGDPRRDDRRTRTSRRPGAHRAPGGFAGRVRHRPRRTARSFPRRTAAHRRAPVARPVREATRAFPLRRRGLQGRFRALRTGAVAGRGLRTGRNAARDRHPRRGHGRRARRGHGAARRTPLCADHPARSGRPHPRPCGRPHLLHLRPRAQRLHARCQRGRDRPNRAVRAGLPRSDPGEERHHGRRIARAQRELPRRRHLGGRDDAAAVRFPSSSALEPLRHTDSRRLSVFVLDPAGPRRPRHERPARRPARPARALRHPHRSARAASDSRRKISPRRAACGRGRVRGR